MDKKKIETLVLNEGLTITDLIDVVVDINGFIGVGLIRLGEDLKGYCTAKINQDKAVKFSEEKDKGNIDHLIPVSENVMRSDDYFWDWSNLHGDWVRGVKIPEGYPHKA